MSLDGTRLFPQPAYYSGFGGAVDLGTAVVIPPGGQVHYVRGNGTTTTEYEYDPAQIRDRIYSSVQRALGACVSGRGDTVVVLPGHTENIAAADGWSNLVAGTRIIGLGAGNQRGTITFTAAASTILLDVANVSIDNLIFNCAGPPTSTTALSVAAPFTVSAAGNTISRCRMNIGVDADQLCTAFFTTTAAATDLTIAGCHFHGGALALSTTVFKFVGADRLKFVGNNVSAALTTATDGLLQFATTASTDVLIADNILYANGANDETCIQMAANIANTGWMIRNFMRNGVDGNNNYIVTSGTGVSVALQWNFGVNNVNERGVEEGTASA